jgi:hypothetical protein
VATAIAYAMSPDAGQVTPLAKAGAEIVEQCDIEQIQIVTNQETIVVMDEERARRVREIARAQKRGSPVLSAPDVQKLIGSAREGSLSGEVIDVAGELHFRPDGYRYLVPIDARQSNAEEIYPDAHFRVKADLSTHRGQPDMIIIHSATQI